MNIIPPPAVAAIRAAFAFSQDRSRDAAIKLAEGDPDTVKALLLAMLRLCDALAVYYGGPPRSLVYAWPSTSGRSSCPQVAADLAQAVTDDDADRARLILDDPQAHLSCYLRLVAAALAELISAPPTLVARLEIPDDLAGLDSESGEVEP